MLWFLRGLRRGVVTTRYPAGALDRWTSALPSPPAFRSQRMTDELADQLQAICPSGALRREDRELVVDLGACSCCGRCAELGDGAVVASGEFLLAVRRRGDLVKRVPLAGGVADRPRSDA